jgi:hypothetical protein
MDPSGFINDISVILSVAIINIDLRNIYSIAKIYVVP